MKITFFLSFICMVAQPLSAQDVSVWIKEATVLEKNLDEKGAFLKLQEVLKRQPNNVPVLAKASELCSRIGSRQTVTTNRNVYFNTALVYAQRAVKLAPANDEANVSLAMILGKKTMDMGKKEKLENARLIKKYVDAAIKSNPSNYLAWHILGRWNYEIGRVSSIEKAGAKVFYGGVPEGSIKNAITYFEKARSLSPEFILNYVELAKAYHKDGQAAKAVEVLKIATQLTAKTEDDQRHKADAQRLIAQWK